MTHYSPDQWATLILAAGSALASIIAAWKGHQALAESKATRAAVVAAAAAPGAFYRRSLTRRD